jgi:hypothetical protein
MIKIDFHGGTHGHFLEYVSNVYIMQTPGSTASIFKKDTGSAHDADSTYTSNRLIRCGHYSQPIYNLNINDDDTIIRIILDSDNDDLFFIATTNLIYKAGDIGFETQMTNIPESIRQNAIAYRNDWYSKFNERNLYSDHYKEFRSISNPIFKFPFESFFSFNNFCKSLNELAFFLNQTFFPDESLYQLWTEFIEKNQGQQSYVKCDQIIQDIFNNKNRELDNLTVIEEAWINYNLSKICRIYNGDRFDNITYPQNTQHIYKEIQEHLSQLR